MNQCDWCNRTIWKWWTTQSRSFHPKCHSEYVKQYQKFCDKCNHSMSEHISDDVNGNPITVCFHKGEKCHCVF